MMKKTFFKFICATALSSSLIGCDEGSNITEIRVKVPGTTVDKIVKASGAVFAGVKDANAMSVEAFNDASSPGIVKAQPSNGRFSFAAVKANQQKITGIIIKTSNAALVPGVKDIGNGGSKDLVVDDFIYSEPMFLQ